MEANDLMRVSLRLHQRNPEHARIINVLKDLNKSRYSTLNSFVIEAITFYIENVSDTKITNTGKAKAIEASKHFITDTELDKRFDLYDQGLKRWLLDSFIPLVHGVGISSSPASKINTVTVEKEPDSDFDLSRYPDVMNTITAWSED